MATKAELLDRAETLNIEGRSSMNKDQLEAAIAAAEATPSTATAPPAADAPSPITTMADLNPTRPTPKSGSLSSVSLTAPNGSRVSVPERLADKLKAQGYK